MSIRSILDNTAIRNEALQQEPQQSRAPGKGLVFQDILAASTNVKGMKNEADKQISKTADILSLEMMRSALCLDVSPPPSAAWGEGRLNALVAAYGIEGLPAGMAGSKSVSQTAANENGATTRVDAVPQSAINPDGNAPALASLISKASKRYGVDEGLIRAVIQVESNFKPTAVSSAGAKGLMQLMPATAASLGVTDPFNPEQNIMAGTRFLKDMLNRYGGDTDRALAAYNWGPGNLERGKGRLPRETQDYLVKVKKLYAENGVG